MDTDGVAQVRRFNRSVTRRIGVLSEPYLSRKLSLPEARVLWEIGFEGLEVRMLRSRLGLDAGYLSRVLASLESAGLVRLTPSPRDKRIRFAQPTKRGLAERARLDSRSDELAQSMLEQLEPDDRDQLLEAMRTVERLLIAGTVRVEEGDPWSDDAMFCIASYFAELSRRSGGRFDPTTTISAAPQELVWPYGRMVIARREAEPVGCGVLKLHGDEPCEIKRMWVAESARGAGIGRSILRTLEETAVRNGATVAHLETNAALTEAIGLYKSAGYVEVLRFNDEPFADHWFEKKLV